jgi:hypothetical protein
MTAGFGRVDAFGEIFNQVLMDIDSDAQWHESNAPVTFECELTRTPLGPAG